MKTEQSRLNQMIYSLNIHDFENEEEIIDVVRNVLKMHKANIFKNPLGTYEATLSSMILRIESCREDLLETLPF
jgi:hypothetical protein